MEEEEEKKKKKNELFAQLHLGIFCVGIRQMDSTKQILDKTNIVQRSINHSFTFMVSELLENVPGAMKKFNKIIAPKEKLLKENPQQQNEIFFQVILRELGSQKIFFKKFLKFVSGGFQGPK